jgi:hypothetical protein
VLPDFTEQSVAACWVLHAVPEAGGPRRPLALDPAGGLLAVLGLGGVIYALTAGPASGWGDTLVLASAAVGVACLVALVPVELRRRRPMLRTAAWFGERLGQTNAD